jgi:hypothetical protein
MLDLFMLPLNGFFKNAPVAKWNNVVVGGIVFSLAVYQDWRDERAAWNQHDRKAQ